MAGRPSSVGILICLLAISGLRLVASEPSSVCPSQASLFLNALESQCPLHVPPSTPLEVAGESIDRILSHELRSSYTSILFYSSWCPFSLRTRSTYEILSSMFPQITHLAVEESKVMPVVFSKYGIHSLPVILIANQTSRVRYYGLKDLSSLVRFYSRITGVQPSDHFARDLPISFEFERPRLLWDLPPRELLKREPYMVFSILFICLMGLVYFFPDMVSQLKAFWISYMCCPNLSFFWETSQVLSRVFHLIDIKRIWSKVRLCKARNFQNGAKSARVWASSLASVSLGESSSMRSVGAS